MTGDHDDPVPSNRREVAATYDRIAPHFSEKRQNPWPEVESFLENRRAEIAIDIGCGNGRHTELLAAIADRAIGLDVSRGVLGEARDRQRRHGFAAELVQADASILPFHNDGVDLAVYVAALHHLPSREARIASLDELARALEPGAEALLSVWSTEHDAFDETAGFDTTVSFTMPDGTAVPRFYHIYDPEEFAADLAKSDVVVEREWVSHGNCYAVVSGPR